MSNKFTPPTPTVRAVRELVAKFPNAPALTLAKKLFRSNPALWPTLESCRTAVRKCLGVGGAHNRRHTMNKTLFREPRKAGAWCDAIPPALETFDDWRAVQFDGPLKVLVLSDVHLPYHNVEAVKLAIQFGIDRNVNLVLLNGDIFDFYAVSRWEKDPRKRDFPAEVRAGRQFLKMLRQAFPRAKIVFKEGNHEERFEVYLRVKAPDLLGIEEFTWEDVYGLGELKIEHVGDKRPVRLGKLNVIHGHEYRFNISNPVNPARGFFLRCKAHVLGGHFHQTAEHSEKNLEQKVVSAWSVGCLCNEHPDWLPLNNWCLGFAYVEAGRDGSFRVENLRIVNGRVW